MKKEYVLIDKNNVIVEMIKIDDKEKIKEKSIYKSNYRIEERKDYMFKGLNLNRVVNDIILSNKEAIKRGLIKLKDNEVLINDSIQTIDKTQKVVNNEIVEKTNEEKLNEGLITSEEYNNIQNEKREKEYESKTDKQVIELMRNFLNKNKDSLSNDDKTILDSINIEIEAIKQEYPKQN
ncbi:phage tail protein [Brachyspira hyodysenteriae]|uniref:phage tail protein n=1 Tax=Brachyspira hyodysenteriae TaxID=159 RepID=UPI0022CD437C|nr:phage tail protein [Brachyspira hyodysenteriae]MCZ9838368.1 phage tail protein [Brachyspira hyodysenteriae]MCZ9849478.1 phage tail protein [Brachyspira hyodysenteriae]MCZ9850233.1 phage tail protein [Brachyspira hyodysenteriae]MCZ9861014.1 phage tail protein [Brachyspira hyodysenteriae]MCZ9870719.1 phage tail protein [Brachyspira hyodysenteriae]